MTNICHVRELFLFPLGILLCHRSESIKNKRGLEVVYVSQTQMEEIDFLLTESGRGFHLLFDNDVIKKFLSRNINEEELFNDEKLLLGE